MPLPVSMDTLLVQSCSKSKTQTDKPVLALELYSGYYYKIIKKAKRENDLDPTIDLCILSAKHGLVEPYTEHIPYHEKMDANRARELRDDVKRDLKRRIRSGDYEEVLINMGRHYRAVIQGLNDEITIPIRTIDGKLGERRRELKRCIRKSTSHSVEAD